MYPVFSSTAVFREKCPLETLQFPVKNDSSQDRLRITWVYGTEGWNSLAKVGDEEREFLDALQTHNGH